MSGGVLLAVDDLDVRYGGVKALEGVSLELMEGEFRAILGPNGAGKTTIVRAITGLLSHHRGRVTAGSIRLSGDELVGKLPHQIIGRGIAQVPEGRIVLADGTVDENLRLGVSALKVGVVELRRRLDDVYERFPQLQTRRQTHAGMLSGGEQQMVAIGRALVAQPKLLVCDELSLGLAPLVVQQLLSTIGETCRESGAACLLIEQNARLALSFCDHAYVLETGRVGASGRSEYLRTDAAVMELYLGATDGRTEAAVRPARGVTEEWPTG